MISFFQGLGLIILIAIGLFIVIVIIYAISRRAGGVTIPGALMPARKTAINIGLLLGSYFVCLLAIKKIWPDMWYAWRSDGFWLTQLLLISMIGFLASQWIKTKHLRWLSWIPGVLALILIVTSVYNNWPKKEHSSMRDLIADLLPKKTSEFKQIEIPIQLPGSWWVYDTLRKSGDIAPHYIPPGYHMHTFGSAKKAYGYRPNGGVETIVGNGEDHTTPINNITNIDISFYKEPVIVSCFTVKDDGRCTYLPK